MAAFPITGATFVVRTVAQTSHTGQPFSIFEFVLSRNAKNTHKQNSTYVKRKLMLRHRHFTRTRLIKSGGKRDATYANDNGKYNPRQNQLQGRSRSLSVDGLPESQASEYGSYILFCRITLVLT